MEDFNIGAMKARNIAAQFGVIEKAETSDEEVMKAHQVGDMHPNGKWVWTEYRPGHFDWRPLKGRGGVDRTPQGGGDDKKSTKQETGNNDDFETFAKQYEKEFRKKYPNSMSKNSEIREGALREWNKKHSSGNEDKKKIAGVSDIMEGFRIQTNKYSDLSKMSLQKTPKGNWRLYYDGKDTGTTMQASVISDANAKKAGLWKEEGEEKKAPTLDDHAKKTDTKTLENAAKSPKAPGSVKGAAEAELKERKNKEIAKKLNLHSKGELATELTRIASEWDSYDDAQKTQTKQAIAQAHSTVLKNITSGNASDEAIAALADLTSIQNFFKDSASQPKQVGDIVKDLVADLKAKNASDTIAGKEKLGDLSKKVSGLSDGKALSFSSNDKSIELKREKTFDDGTVQYTMYVDGVGVYTTINADNAAKKMNELFPDAKEKQGENKVKLTEGGFKKGVVEKDEYTRKNAIDLHDYTGESIEYYTDNGEKKKAQPYISEFYNSAKQDAVGGYEAYFDRADSIGTFRTLKEAISALETWINNMRVKGHDKPEWIYNESRGRYQMNYRFN